MALDFVSALRDRLRKDMNDYTDDVATGSCPNYENYAKLCGVIQGLAIAERHLFDLAKALEEADE